MLLISLLKIICITNHVFRSMTEISGALDSLPGSRLEVLLSFVNIYSSYTDCNVKLYLCITEMSAGMGKAARNDVIIMHLS